MAMVGVLARIKKSVLSQDAGGEPLTYDEQKYLARHDHPQMRLNLAARADARPEILYYLAEDDSVEVRQIIAANPETPRHATLRLAADKDETVRCALAERLVAILPGLSHDGQRRLREQTFEALEVMARDQLPRIRKILADALKDLPDAPPAVIRCLAEDTEIDIAGPVLRSSPVLCDQDIIEIIRATSTPGVLGFISDRDQVSEAVSDAIVATDDAKAIATLLGNPSAQIREETLDLIIDRAPAREEWHAPLARRPSLSPDALCRIACFVADSLLEELMTRDDFDAGTMKKVAAEMHRRLAAEKAAPAPARPIRDGDGKDSVAARMARARQLHKAGTLDAETIGVAIDDGDRSFAMAQLAVLADLKPALVEKIVGAQSPKGLVALTWKAGLDMECAIRVQLHLGRIPPRAALFADVRRGFPLSPDDMDWQIEFFAAALVDTAPAAAG